MGRLLVLIILIAAAILIWKAFGPSTWQSKSLKPQRPPQIKGPDDDPEFLWKLEKEQFKRRKEQERLRAEKEAQERRHHGPLTDDSEDGSGGRGGAAGGRSEAAGGRGDASGERGGREERSFDDEDGSATGSGDK